MTCNSSNNGLHKFLIVWVVYVVIVGKIASLFFFSREVMLWMHGYRVTIRAAIIMVVIAFGMGVVKPRWGRTKGTIHRWSIGNEWENCWGEVVWREIRYM